MTNKKIRVLIAKPGLDGHDRGAKVLCLALRDAGMEVIYTGLHKTPDEIAEAALQEGVDMVGLSIMSGAHLTLTRRVLEAMRGRGLESLPLLVGGVIPAEDMAALEKAGAAGIFPVGSPFDSIVHFIKEKTGGKEG
jgi:methylmalonyl-CoA mutase C-terminal domain/subunit